MDSSIEPRYRATVFESVAGLTAQIESYDRVRKRSAAHGEHFTVVVLVPAL